MQRSSSARSLWADWAIVVSLLALPTAVTSATIALLVRAMASLPRFAITALALGLYGVGVWISVCLTWRWSVRRNLFREVFVFCRLTWLDAAIVLVGFLITFYAAPIIFQWAMSWIGGSGLRRLDLRASLMIAMFVFSTLISAPVGEEILFRGLLVAWLRRLDWPLWAIWPVGSIAFASIHIPFFGLAWSVQALFFGALILAIRLWRHSLTPGWLIHLLFNARYLVVLPLWMWLMHAL